MNIEVKSFGGKISFQAWWPLSRLLAIVYSKFEGGITSPCMRNWKGYKRTFFGSLILNINKCM